MGNCAATCVCRIASADSWRFRPSGEGRNPEVNYSRGVSLPRARHFLAAWQDSRQRSDPPALLHFSDTELTPALGARLTATAGRLRLPVMLVRGGGSELVSEADAEHFLVLVPGARYANIADAGHMVAGDVNDRFGDAVIDFLQSSRTMKTS